MQNAATPFLTFFSVGLLALVGCSSPNPVESHRIAQFDPAALRVRRPVHESMDLETLPPGNSAPFSGSETFDCEKVETLFQKLTLARLRSCFVDLSVLSGKKEPYEAHYRLRREIQPLLELQDVDKAPACLRQELRELRVPREVVFQKSISERSFQECYTSRLDTEADRILGIQLPMNRVDLVIHFPLHPIPRSDAELTRLLSAWVLTLFKNRESGAFDSKYLPSVLCRQCWSESVQHPPGPESEHQLWP